MGKVKIDRDDTSRILLTELLPYEVPMLFSNEGFYFLVVNKRYGHFFNRVEELSNIGKSKTGGVDARYGIPFNYEIGKNSFGDTRTLSIIHPYNQVKFIELYKKYDSLMINLCSKSPFSLRKITKVAKFFYSPRFVFDEDGHKSADVETESDIWDQESKYLKSYFTYQPLDLIYKFYDRQDYQRLEQRFNFLLEIDISKCFYNIYTHSITWAIKDRESAKRNGKSISFENQFDRLMQLANYNETNGIIVGPEVSRIFAEIILQQIDIDVLIELENKEEYKYKFGEHYEIRRYVDDYFIFSNDEKVLMDIKKVYQNKLNFYKLYLNPAKSEIKTTPFITNTTVGKRELHQLLKSFFTDLIKYEEIQDENGIKKEIVLKALSRPYSVSQFFIKDFQCIVKRNNLTYDLLSKDLIRDIKKHLVQILKGKTRNDIEVLENFLLMLVDITFYAYSLNINSNTTFKLSQIIVLIQKFLNKKPNSIKHSIYSKILKDADFALVNFQRKIKIETANIEILNLLIALKKLGINYAFSEERLRKIFNISKIEDFSKLNYFHIITLLYYIENHSQYLNLKNDIENSIVEKFENSSDIFGKTEFTLLFFDLICCPFLSTKTKRKTIAISQYPLKNQTIEDVMLDIMNQRKFFMDWDTEIDLERILKRKEWSSTY